MSKITSYGFEFDTAALPGQTLDALISRGLNHVLGNEVASKIAAFKSRIEKETGVAATDEAVSAQTTAERQAMIDKLVAGTLGVRVAAAPSVDPIEAEMTRLAKAKIATVLKANGLKWAKDAEGVRTVTLKNGTFTMAELVERQLTGHGEALRAEAEKVLKAKARAAKAAAEADIDL